MKQLLCLITLCVPLLLFSQSDTTNKGIKWTEGLSWKQVKQKAKQENKYIFVDCFATWCVPCKMMDEKVYSNWRVGDEVNKFFISIQLQMDSTIKDDLNTRNWYNTAKQFIKEFKIEGFPTYLFFTPEGTLVHKDGGYQNLINFLQMTTLARDPQKPFFYTLYEDYKKGKKIKEVKQLKDLANFTKKLIRDESTAYKMAKDYKKRYLDKLDDSQLFTRDNILFLGYFNELISTSDRMFSFLYKNPPRVDTIAHSWAGWAKSMVTSIIIREEIEKKVIKNDKLITKSPDWDKIESKISKNYKNIDATEMLLNYKISFYKSEHITNWRLWAKYKDEKLQRYTPTKERYTTGWELGGDLNQFGAWTAFLSCPDTIVLRRAMDWINIALKFESENADYIDTKANLLYKLGQRDEAIKLQEKAVSLDPKDDWKKSALVKMRQGTPTWSK